MLQRVGLVLLTPLVAVAASVFLAGLAALVTLGVTWRIAADLWRDGL